MQSFLLSYQRLYFDQITFENIVASIFEEYDEFETIEIFDLLETKGDGFLTVKELYVFILLQAAVEDNQALMCQYIHGELIFSVISGDQDVINVNRLENMLRVIGYHESEIETKIDEFHLNESSLIDSDLFNTILFSIFKEISPTMIDLELTHDELKLAEAAEIEEKLSFDDYNNYHKESTKNAVSPNGQYDDIMDINDPFQVGGNNLDGSNSENNDSSKKEVTNMPLKNVDYEMDGYNSKGYSTKPYGTNDPMADQRHNHKDSITKYIDPYADSNDDFRKSQKTAKIAGTKLKSDSKESSHQHTDGDQIINRKVPKDDEAMY